MGQGDQAAAELSATHAPSDSAVREVALLLQVVGNPVGGSERLLYQLG